MNIKEKRIMYAQILQEFGVDLQKDYFAQPSDKIRIIRDQCSLFKFKSVNPCRTDAQQFYYAAQAGLRYLND